MVACTAAVLAMFSYAIYYAFGIRRKFSADLYRRQALGMGLIALVELVLTVVNVALSFVPPNIPPEFLYTNVGAIGGALFTLFFPVLFNWIDYSAIVARRFDPMSRDSLHWSRVRVILRPVVFLSGAGIFAISIVQGILSGYLIATTFSPPVSGALLYPFGVFFILLIIGVPVAGIALLPISAKRTKDPQLRRQLAWFGVFAVVYTATNFISGSISPLLSYSFVALFVWAGTNLAYGYFLYRSARSLVPLYSFARDTASEGGA